MSSLVRFASSVERAIARHAPDGRRPVFDQAQFPWAAELEAGWRSIREELDAVMTQRDAIPNFQDISPEQRALTDGDDWKSYFFYGYGHRLQPHCDRCPETARWLTRIPGMTTAMFSILAPHKHIPPHRGPYNGVLRYHLGLLVPAPLNSCRIRVADHVYCYREGRSLVFDDTFTHEVWNDSEGFRVVLFVDFIRPLPFPLSALNRLALQGLSRSASMSGAVQRARQAAHPSPGARGPGER